MYSLAAAQLIEILDEKVGVECVGMVVVELCSLLVAHAVVSLIVVVVIYNADISAETLHDLARYCGFAAAGAAGNADHHYAAVFHTLTPVYVFCFIIPHRRRRRNELIKPTRA